MNKKIRDKALYHLCAILIALIPFAISIIYGLLQYGSKMQFHIPTVTDECVYYSQLDSMVHYGNPLGYFGYVGSKGLLANWSTWGPGIIIPYFLFAKVFGLGLNTMYYANLFYIGLALYLFIVLTKLPVKKMPLVGLVAVVSPILMNYNMSSMAESFRQAWGIIIMACIYRVIFNETARWYKYIVVPAVILFGMFTFVIHGMWVLVYFLWLFDHKQILPKIKFALSVGITGVISVGMYLINSLLSAGFYGGNIAEVMNKYHESGSIVETVRFFVKMTVYRFVLYDPVHILSDLTIPKYTFLIFWILIAAVLVVIFAKKVKLSEKADELLCFYMLAGTYFIYLFIYTEYEWNILRGISIAMVNCILWMIARDKKYYQLIYLIGFGLIFFSTFDDTGTVFKMRSSYEQEIDYYNCTKETLTELMPLDKSNRGWANTVNVYGYNYQLDLMMPSGVGIEQVWYWEDGYDRAHWSAAETTSEINESLLEHGYTVIYQDDIITVYDNWVSDTIKNL